ncbi:atrial natriuretic peptide receptor 1 [Polypterus senegalus]|uniref:atrial natriuretic peptide receptor 1 n=1 Tax=Polypterus senegalus TaxID=55291 RepID=UPI001964AB66|nr:atrial natriuretic peptide receptor 1 [Polypterus senegalus]
MLGASEGQNIGRSASKDEIQDLQKAMKLALAKIFITVTVMEIHCSALDFKILISMPNISVPFSAGRIGAGTLIALDEVNEDPVLLAGHHLVFDFVDDECDAVKGTGKIVDLKWRNNYSAFIGPSCSSVCSHGARLAAYWNIPVINPLCADSEFLNKKEFSTLTRVFGPFTKMGNFLVKICENFGWRRIGIIAEDIPTWSIPAEGIKYTAQQQNITLTIFKYFKLNVGSYLNTSLSFPNLIKEVSSVSRIIVIFAEGELVRSFLIEAHKLGLINGEYVFFCFEPYSQKQTFGIFHWKRGDQYDERAKEAFQALFILSLYKPNDEKYMNFSAEVIRRSKETFGYIYEPDEEVSVLAAISHDSVTLYAQVLHEVLEEGKDPYNGSEITARMRGRSITGIQGDVTIDENGDRESDYMMYQIQNDENGSFVVVAKYFGNKKTYEQVPGFQILWPGGRTSVPLDIPMCGFKGEFCNNHQKGANSIIIAAGVMGCLFVIVTVALSLIYRKYKLQEKASKMLWKVDFNDLTWIQGKQNSSMYKLSHYTVKSQNAFSETNMGNITQQKITKTALYKENTCFVRYLHMKSINMNEDLHAELNLCNSLHHPNICCFTGACVDPPNLCLLTEYCPKGSLQDILENMSIKLDWTFKYSLMLDIVQGMDYLHKSPLKSHGYLSSSNCVVDSRFVLKITDFGLSGLRRPHTEASLKTTACYQSLLWRAPELLREEMPRNGTQKGDVYSFGIIVHEIVYQSGVFYIPGCILQPHEIVEKIKTEYNNPFRPHTDKVGCPQNLENLMKSCWSEKPSERPDFSILKISVKKLDPNIEFRGSENILDNLLLRMEQYANNLEELVNERTAKFLEEKQKAESLLTQMLPQSVAIQLVAGKTVEAETYDNVTIYFSDIVGFTSISASITPMQVVELLNSLYTYFDNIIDHHDVYKVETIGDAYMVVSGLPIRNGDEHAKEIARMSLAILNGVKDFKSKHIPGHSIRVRIGIHSGPCVAGVVGLKMPRYCLFGDTVNTASRMESSGLPLKIHISTSTKELLDKFKNFKYELRGDIEIKGKGVLRTYWLLEECHEENCH